MTARLRVEWPDAEAFTARDGRPIRILAISDEPDPTLDSPSNREALLPVDLVVGCGDLTPDYLEFAADAFCAPLHYVRGNHDAGAAWTAGTRDGTCPLPLPDGEVVTEAGVRVVGFGGSAKYSDAGYELTHGAMWWRVLKFAATRRVRGPVLVVTHAAPRDANDGPDNAHRGFPAFRWLAGRLQPPLWLHGHTTLIRRDIESRTARIGRTLLYNCEGSTLIELVAPGTSPASDGDKRR